MVANEASQGEPSNDVGDARLFSRRREAGMDRVNAPGSDEQHSSKERNGEDRSQE